MFCDMHHIAAERFANIFVNIFYKVFADNPSSRPEAPSRSWSGLSLYQNQVTRCGPEFLG